MLTCFNFIDYLHCSRPTLHHVGLNSLSCSAASCVAFSYSRFTCVLLLIMSLLYKRCWTKSAKGSGTPEVCVCMRYRQKRSKFVCFCCRIAEETRRTEKSTDRKVSGSWENPEGKKRQHSSFVFACFNLESFHDRGYKQLPERF